MQSRTPTNVQCTLSSRLSNARTSSAATATEGRASAKKVESASARAVRPLAASARPQRFVAASCLRSEPALGVEEEVWLPELSGLDQPKNPMFGQVTACSEPIQALPRSAKPNTGRAATSFACGGGFGLLASRATQRPIQAGSVPHALPNPSIEGDVQGLSPSAAPHVKR